MPISTALAVSFPHAVPVIVASSCYSWLPDHMQWGSQDHVRYVDDARGPLLPSFSSSVAGWTGGIMCFYHTVYNGLWKFLRVVEVSAMTPYLRGDVVIFSNNASAYLGIRSGEILGILSSKSVRLLSGGTET